MSLDLDDRQRAMLLEMGVRVWWPAPTEASLSEDDVSDSKVLAIENQVLEAISAGAAAVMPKPGSSPSASISRSVSAPPLATPAGTECLPLAAGIDAMDWDALSQTIATCQACLLCSGRRSAVFAADMAPRQADWLLVGEPPDEAEERAGAAFADQSGQLLDNMLKALGLSRRADAAGSAQAAYLTNVVKCRPARARNPEPAELVVCENYLRREIALVQPKVILAMGRFAAQALLQSSAPELTGTPLGKLRRQIYRYQGLPVVVTYHPAYLLRNQSDKARAWADLCLARQAAAGRL